MLSLVVWMTCEILYFVRIILTLKWPSSKVTVIKLSPIFIVSIPNMITDCAWKGASKNRMYGFNDPCRFRFCTQQYIHSLFVKFGMRRVNTLRPRQNDQQFWSRHFKTNSGQWKFMYFDSDIIEICFGGWVWFGGCGWWGRLGAINSMPALVQIMG